jgi:ABC-type bacteriocin/lantibiotic exporter with double-glycine peptidase domain
VEVAKQPGHADGGQNRDAIAHRLSTIAAMDNVVLDEGRVVEAGDHRSLLAAGSRAAVGAPERRVSGRPTEQG